MGNFQTSAPADDSGGSTLSCARYYESPILVRRKEGIIKCKCTRISSSNKLAFSTAEEISSHIKHDIFCLQGTIIFGSQPFPLVPGPSDFPLPRTRALLVPGNCQPTPRSATAFAAFAEDFRVSRTGFTAQSEKKHTHTNKNWSHQRNQECPFDCSNASLEPPWISFPFCFLVKAWEKCMK